MLDELAGQFEAWGSDAKVRVVVLRGAGRHFCAGADVGAQQPQTTERPGTNLVELVLALDALPKPTVALVQGACVGGGLAITACCDAVLADEGAFFSIPEARLGFTATALLPVFVRAIGYRNFRRYGLSGERIGSAEALRIGLVHQLVTVATGDEVLAGLADAMLHSAPGSLRDFKAAAARYVTPDLASLPLAELEARFHQSRSSAEATEGIASFREKRKPNWYPAP
jgi:methylglutaconyl-CoA hydratase